MPSKLTSKPTIFVNYRKDDSGDVAIHLRDALQAQFPGFCVFIDHGIPEQANWDDVINAALDHSVALIVLVGPHWATIAGVTGRPRLFEDGDYVRMEIEHALSSKIPVIVVRTEKADFPRASILPTSIQSIMDNQGSIARWDMLSQRAFMDDVGRLSRTISSIWKFEIQPKSIYREQFVAHGKTSGAFLRKFLKLFVSRELSPAINRRLSPNIMLREDPKLDLADYSGETPVTASLPYVEVCNWCPEVVADEDPDIRVHVLPEQFELKSWGSGPGDDIREAALAAAIADKPKTFNGPTVRVDRYEWHQRTLSLYLMRALYYDQRRSNLAMDYRYSTARGSTITLRDLLKHEYGNRLPPIEDRRLANTLGVAALIFIRSRDQLVPYILPRTKDVAVFNAGGEWHCTASGVVESPVGSNVTALFHYDSMLKELWEEVGLLPHDLKFLRPVAFCREMGRGGKPQMFFLGLTDVAGDQLNDKLRSARKWTEARGQVLENTLMPVLRKPADLTSEEVRDAFYKYGFTAEVAACMHYFNQCRSLPESANSWLGS